MKSGGGKKHQKKNRNESQRLAVHRNRGKEKSKSLLPWVLLVGGIVAVCFFPALKNELTNWDDDFYVIQNPLLQGPDWKGIFSLPVVGNYHPLTIISLAINFQLSQLAPFGYHLVNYLLHIANSALVFYFIYQVSGRKVWVALITAIVFGLHPMHVESVAWVAERKDVLYTLFFLLSLISYQRYLEGGKKISYLACFGFFALSLLSKPAAVILPLVLFLLDYLDGRPLKKPVVLEKLPFFLLSILFGIITLQVQSSTAITGMETFPVWVRPFFGSYVLMIYFLRFFIPYPLSAFHPYPPINALGPAIYASPLFVLALAAAIWYFRKNRMAVFGLLFFVINLVLVLQLLTIGSTLVSERYTYVPYIGLGFLLGMWINSSIKNVWFKGFLVAGICLAFCIITYQRIAVWENSETLWTDVIDRYPDAAVPRNQRAVYYAQLSDKATDKKQATELLKKALEDCNMALKGKPDYQNALENRQHIYLNLQRPADALADAETLIRFHPGNYPAHFTRGMAYFSLNDYARALPELQQCISMNPAADNVLNALGSIHVNFYQQFPEALAEFDKAISINPAGIYYFNRSVCHYRMGNFEKAKQDAQTALQKGIVVPVDYRKLLNL